jgi:hypothetical protein
MFLILAVLVLILIFGVAGFTIHLLWIVAAIVAVIWLFGFATRGRGRWYKR